MKIFNNQKGVAHIALMLLLLAGLGVGVYLVSQTQVFRPQADDPNANLSQGLVGYWKFDEASGSAVIDSSGNNNNGSWRGTLGNQWVAGKYGNAGSFNGTNNTVAINNNASLSPAGSFTIASWVKRGNTTAYSYGILAKGNLSSSTTNAGYGLFLTAANQYSLRLSGNSVNPVAVVSNKTYIDTNWHHVVGVYEPGTTSQTATQSGKMSIYVDGALVGTQTKNVPSSVSTNTLPLTIGAISTGLTANTWYWNGQLEEVRLYNRVLSAAEVSQLYNYNPTQPSPSPSYLGNSPRMRAFVTSTTYNGNLGGVVGADAKCQERANAANLGGTWKAWISGSLASTAPAQRFIKFNGPYTTVQGSLIAYNWEDLTNGGLFGTPINSTEYGQSGNPEVTSQRVWTNVKADGTTYDPDMSASTCLDWTSASDSQTGNIGWYTYDTDKWTIVPGIPAGCGNSAPSHLYCFEQPTSSSPSPTSSPIAATSCSSVAVTGATFKNTYQGQNGTYYLYTVQSGAQVNLTAQVTPNNATVNWKVASVSSNLPNGGAFGTNGNASILWTAPINSKTTEEGVDIRGDLSENPWRYCPTITFAVQPAPSPSPSSSPVATAKRVFVTSTTYTGNLGGLAGADAKCQARANAANLGGTWKAWLSDDYTLAGSRLSHNNGPYQLINGQTLANNWTSLIMQNLQSSIKLTELNQEKNFAGVDVWTNTDRDGGRASTGSSCRNWSSADPFTYGRTGYSAYNDSRWSVNSIKECTGAYSLYCFEQ